MSVRGTLRLARRLKARVDSKRRGSAFLTRLRTLPAATRIRLHVWYLRGCLSPQWIGRFPNAIRWLTSIVIGIAISVLLASLTSSPDDAPVLGEQWLSTAQAWPEQHVWFAGLGGLGLVILLGYVWWATGDAGARRDILALAAGGRLMLPVADFAPDDLLPDRSRSSPPTTFLPRRIRAFGQDTAEDQDALPTLTPLFPADSRRGRRLALLGSASMGKTRLAHALIERLPPDTVVFSPDPDLGDLTAAEVRHGTRYLSGKACVLVFDDLNDYAGSSIAPLAVVPRNVVHSREAGVAPSMPPCGRR